MHFAQPAWIIFGIIISPLLFMLFRLLEQRRHSALARFAAPHLLGRLIRNLSRQRRQTKQLLLILAIFLCCTAMARPQMGFTWVETEHKGVDILFALDTSKSMLAADFKPNRLERARYGIIDFVRKLGGDRVGLLAFAGSAFLSCPLTLDYNAFEQTLLATDTESIPLGGTNLAVVISEAEKVLANSHRHKILVLLTDGENLQGEAITAAENAAEKGLTIHTIGVGTIDGELVPADEDGQEGFVRNRGGTYVTSRLDDTTLRKIADTTAGLYVPLGSSGEGLETIYRQRLSLLPKDTLGERRQKQPVERYSWPLMLALVILVVEFLLPEQKRSGPVIHSLRTWRFKKNTKLKVLLILLPCLVLCCSFRESAAGQGEVYYDTGEYPKAAEFYRRALDESPDDSVLHYNNGTATYRNNLFDEAIAAFSKALTTDDLDLQHRSYHNRGNAYYRKGNESLQTDPRQTIEQWRQAIESYEAALKLREEQHVRHNRDLVAKKLQELQKQQKQKQGQGQGQGQGQKKNTEEHTQQQQTDRAGQKQEEQQERPAEKPGESDGNHIQPKPSLPDSDAEEPQSLPEDVQLKDSGNKPEENHSRPQGRMTSEEALRLLDGMQTEERPLPGLAPRTSDSQNDQPEKNW